MMLSPFKGSLPLFHGRGSLLRKSIVCREHSTSHGSVLVFSSLYPQPSASAAGVRTEHILKKLCSGSSWDSIHYATGAKDFNQEEVSELERRGVMFHSVQPNRSQQVKDLLDKIHDLSLVIFDRFYAEEAYSFHIHNLCPDAVRVVDMQDMHSLRLGRQALAQKWNDPCDLKGCLEKVMKYRPPHSDPRLLRELSSVHRSDLTLVCSPFEQDLLESYYKVPPSKLCLASFWVSPFKDDQPSFEERHDFCVLGGFRHAPNVDAVQQLAQHIWPRIRAKLPNARVHVYGAYAPPQIKRLHNSESGFEVHGFAPSLRYILSNKRVLLATLRFGAGIKGKILDAWHHGVPVETTPVGSEGMLDNCNAKEWGGVVASSIDEFVRGAIQLHSANSMWCAAQDRGKSLLSRQFNENHWTPVAGALRQAVLQHDERRSTDFTGAMLWHHSARSTEYMSRWIECKERGK